MTRKKFSSYRTHEGTDSCKLLVGDFNVKEEIVTNVLAYNVYVPSLCRKLLTSQ